jgi:hypothetical protein
LSGGVAFISQTDEVAEARPEIEFLRKRGLKSALNVPFLVGGKLIGCLSTASSREYLKWDSVMISRFQQIGNIFANALARKRDDERLHRAYAEISMLKERLEQENTYLREEIQTRAQPYWCDWPESLNPLSVEASRTGRSY